ncbi:MAG: low molecular weight phosphotyrosine protein phosphatase, partial [Bacteroidetes bacterium]|nr:low molecular weight phosphotyrosine protein phosphatase [Bacteroidota bacterium]
GNICRSPAAEGVMKHLVKGMDIEIDSAGTAGYHTGELPDPRMRSHARKRGIELTSRARQFDPSVDFERFDMIIAMDDSNLRDLKGMDRSKQYHGKISKMTDYCRTMDADHVPDPYYGGPEGFDHVLDILEDACAGLLERIRK